MVVVYIIYLDICFEPTEVHNTEASSYDQWLPTWLDHLISGSYPGTIPTEARHIQRPLNKAAWQHHLRDYLYQDLPKFFLESISNGFQVGYNGSNLQSAGKNLITTTVILMWWTTFIMNYHLDECQVRILPWPALKCISADSR